VPGNPPAPCRPQLSGQLWLDVASRLTLTFRGGRAVHAVATGGRTWDLAPGIRTDVVLKVPAGPSRFDVSLDWTSAAGAPQLVSARVSGGGTSTDIAYSAG
jgi:hypothetical protein